MDTPATESSALNIEGATDAFDKLLNPAKGTGESEPIAEAKPKDAAAEPAAEPDPNAPIEAETVTIEVDGKPVTLTKEQLADAYKSGLRQADYTTKTMQVAEERKAATAERECAQAERSQYAQKLNEQTTVLTAVLQEQSQINWQQLLDSDPIEYMRQQHLYNQRQAALQNAHREQQIIQHQLQTEHEAESQRNFQEQRDSLLAKLPEWKDEAKATVEKQAIRGTLKEYGFSDMELGNVTDHRAILLARDAMRYREMVAKASAAAKKVENLPNKVERPGTGSAPALDKRSAAFTRLSKSGRVEDAAAVFASLI